MARERDSTSSSTGSGTAQGSSSSSLSDDSLSASSSSSAISSSSDSSSIRENTKSTTYKRSHRRSLSSKSRSRTDRKSSRKNNSREHADYERRRKGGNSSSKWLSHGKYDKKKQKNDSKKRKLDMGVECSKEVLSGKRRKSGKDHEVPIDCKVNEKSNNLLEVALNAQEQQKALIRHNAEIAKARLESGELQKAREEQRKMHQLYGTVDWRANRKLRTEKKMLERSVAAGKSLASLEQREYARMDAFRIALGLPTAEAQRQAEWRREQTQALVELESGSKPPASSSINRCKKAKQGLIGPMLPP